MPAPKVEDLYGPAPKAGPPRVEELYAEPDPHPVQQAINVGIEGSRRLGANVASGFVSGLGGFDHTAANLVQVLDQSAQALSRKFGISYGGAFSKVEQHLRGDSQALMQQAAALAPGDTPADKAAQLIGGLPAGVAKAVAATAAGGQVAGFAGLGALEAADQGPAAALKSAASGALLGSIFKATDTGIGRTARALTVGTGSAALDTAQGHAPEEVALSAGANALFAALGAKPPRKYTGVAPQAIPKEEAASEKPRLRVTGTLAESAPITQAKPAPVGTTGLASIGGAAQAISENLRQQLWDSYRVGKTKMAGIEDPALRAAKAANVPTNDRQAFNNFLTSYAGGTPKTASPTQGKLAETAPSGILVTPRTAQTATEFMGKDYSDITPPDRVMNLNLNRIHGDAEFKAATTDFVNSFRDQIDQARRGTISHVETENLAKDLGMTYDKLMERRRGQALNAEEAVAYRTMNRSALEQWSGLAKKIKDGKASDVDKADFLKATSVAEAVIHQTLGATAEAGRALSSFNIRVGPSTAQMKHLRELLADFKGPKGADALEDFAVKVASTDTPEGLAQLAGTWRQAKTGDKFIEAWINGLLSAPPTHIANALSNTLLSTWAIPQTAGAALVGELAGLPKRLTGQELPADRVRFSEAFAKTQGMIEGMGDGMHLAAKVFRSEQSASPTDLFGAATTVEGRIGAIGRDVDSTAFARRAGQLIRLPTRALMSMDAFGQAVAFRQELRAQAVRKGLSEGKRGAELSRRVGEIVANPSEQIVEASYQFARRQTFTEELGKFGRSIQQFANAHPVMRVILPFTRTPTNIFKTALRSSPLAPFVGEWRAEVKAGGAARDQALAQTGMGSMVMGYVAAKAAEGLITGSGPADKELRESWLLDHQPFSIKVGDAWVSYARTEPLATILGMAADYADISGHVSEDERDELATRLVFSFRRNLANKTFLQGLSGAVEAIMDPERSADKFIQQLAGSVVPAGVAAATRSQDPVLKDTRTMLDRIKSRIPGFGADLPPRRNVLGEPILLSGGVGPDMVSPLYRRPLRNDKTIDELVRVEAQLSAPAPNEDVRGLKLSPQEYSAMLADYGPKAKANMDALVQSPAWPAIPDPLKRKILEDLYADARKAGRDMAFAKIISQDPLRLQAVIQEKVKETLGP